MLLFDLRSNEKKFQKVESLAYIFAADSVGLSSIFIQIFVAGWGSKRHIFSAIQCVSPFAATIKGHPRSI